ncbi:MAG: transcriptional regulator, AraC family [Ramlibacter sp.]|nr:transcriptional regulator, AraC family [Ramlibacter sp.]
MDALSDVLRTIRLQGALFLNGQFHEPWCVDARPAISMAPLLCPGAQQMAILHMVMEGRCWIQSPGEDAIALEPGDVAVLPTGGAHLVGSGMQHAPVSLQHVVPVQVPEVRQVRYGGNGDPCVLVCGWFAYERDAPNPLLASLPGLFKVAVGSRPAGRWLEESVRYATRDAAAGPGSTAIAAKVAESLFIESLRAYLESLPAQRNGWLAGLSDPQVGRCLALMHAQPARPWSLESLAQESHTSRSVLAERFHELLGTPPMQYLKRWRLAMAARMLTTERINVIQVAEAVGYESEASFSRAFKGVYGVPPGAWRNGADRPANRADLEA